ncbi:MAG TPA: cytochrome c oxidase subunit II [Gemmatimonadaceae bacterium]|jgi:cytochrome c oxidase subunit 2
MTQTPLSIFSDASDAASRITHLAWFMIVLSVIVFVAVVAIMAVAVMRGRRNAPTVDLSARGNGWIVWGGAVIPGLILGVIFIVSLGAMSKFSTTVPAMTVHITGHQWWWQVDYLDSTGAQAFRTANELHLPVGKPVRVILTSDDVIHSFWVPQLQGKLDLIPGDTNDLRLEAKRAGIFAGACAEFCGAQHAHMMLSVVAESDSAFAAWRAAQSATAIVSIDSTIATGRRLFVSTQCAQCHTVRGTTARADSAPDLTHVGSRLTLAAGVLPNSLGSIEGWIANPQALKPGAKMPTLRDYTGPELRALAAYVESLK